MTEADPARFFDGKAVLVTGGTGSFGRAFVAALLTRATPRRLVIYSRDELKQYEMEQEFASRDPRGVLRYFIGDVRDAARLTQALRGIDIIVHAAALKHVTIAEYNPFECIRTNVLGAENVVQAAIAAGVQRVIALSTDKAANPANLYGASKLASDKIFIAANHLSGKGGCRFSVVRYGNVVGSRGSVVPLFRRLIAEGADHLPITDPRMTRFWITLAQGVDFVCSSASMMTGGEIFVPKIPSMRITDLASAMAPGLPQKVVGIRPGEKLHEAMITADDARTTLDLGDRYVIEPAIVMYGRGDFRAHGGVPVPEGFRYESDINTDWLDRDGLLSLLASAA
ncbi:UDP-N-acetylglucosamine 4,6-dehydratase (inverting) [Elioraea rosea]|uniref:UDP-N-acetylglucosamine 4,6-dehydratase (inverting) n=1 Tax=Elioraea rosea TaxID=2492390 RepID=UPI0011843485|nr:UDP-N-acetylglucosamine 4,6-dehydratase (inverting) [Elioraea rosea]